MEFRKILSSAHLWNCFSSRRITQLVVSVGDTDVFSLALDTICLSFLTTQPAWLRIQLSSLPFPPFVQWFSGQWWHLIVCVIIVVMLLAEEFFLNVVIIKYSFSMSLSRPSSTLFNFACGMFHFVPQLFQNHLRRICVFYQQSRRGSYLRADHYQISCRIVQTFYPHWASCSFFALLSSCFVLQRLCQPTWHTVRLQGVFIRLIRKKHLPSREKWRVFFVLFCLLHELKQTWNEAENRPTHLERSHLAFIGRFCVAKGSPQ